MRIRTMRLDYHSKKKAFAALVARCEAGKVKDVRDIPQGILADEIGRDGGTSRPWVKITNSANPLGEALKQALKAFDQFDFRGEYTNARQLLADFTAAIIVGDTGTDSLENIEQRAEAEANAARAVRRKNAKGTKDTATESN